MEKAREFAFVLRRAGLRERVVERNSFRSVAFHERNEFRSTRYSRGADATPLAKALQYDMLFLKPFAKITAMIPTIIQRI